MSVNSGLNPQIEGLLKNFIDTTPNADAALLTTGDGIPLLNANLNMSNEIEDTLHARVASVAGAAKAVLGVDGKMEEVESSIIKMTRGVLLVMSAVEGIPHGFEQALLLPNGNPSTVLAVYARRDGALDTEALLYEMGKLIHGLASHLVIPRRSSLGPSW